jgi:cytochrome oxidase Cu insertion factor (SCO1/SenC/PrrC family)
MNCRPATLLIVFTIMALAGFGQTDSAARKEESKELMALKKKIEQFRKNLINKHISDFKLTDLSNKKWNSKDLKEKVVVINFWFTSCEPCIHEMPFLNETVAAYKDKAVVFLAPAPEKDAQVKKFLQRFQFDYNIIPAAIDFIDKMNIENFPTHLIIDKQGIIRQVFVGYSDDIGKKLQEEIDKLI